MLIKLKTRDVFIVAPLLMLAVLCYFVGQHQGRRAQKATDAMHNIRMALRNLRDAEGGQDESIKMRCRMYLLGYTRAYEALVDETAVPVEFRASLLEAQRIADEVSKTLVPITNETFEK